MKNILKNNSGDVGIGTLIVFIAMVLVAAVAAAVLIQTSGVLQQKAQSTGTEAMTEVSSNLKVDNIVGTANANNVSALNISLTLSAGGEDIDMGQVVVNFINDEKLSSDVAFTYTEDRYVTDNQVLSTSELGNLYIDLSTTSQQLDKRATATIQIIPESGTMIVKDIVIPATFGGKTKIALFP